MKKSAHLKIYSKLFNEIYTQKNSELIIHIKDILSPYIDNIVNIFYHEITQWAEAKYFLSHEQIEKHLKPALKLWLQYIFSPKSLDSFDEYIQRKVKIGQAHARIKLPITLVCFGMELLKREISSRITCTSLPTKEKQAALILINRIMDLAAMIINEIHCLNQLESEKISQSFNLHFVSQDLVIECEHSRADLLQWFQELSTTLCFSKNKNIYFPLLSIWNSSFGLWSIHRLPLYYRGLIDIVSFNYLLSEIEDKATESIHNYRIAKRNQLANNINEISVLIKQIDWLLVQLSKDIAVIEKSKDPLTQLMTRRYIPTVLQHEITFCLKNHSSFAIILIDVDHFKKVNDSFGHAIGDAVLGELAKLFTSVMRASDHLFRYGGEEFLILISAVNFEQAIGVAEKLRLLTEEHIFHRIPEFNKTVTISLGCSLFCKHPDYNLLINQADQALYIAKNSGRNKVEMFNPERTHKA